MCIISKCRISACQRTGSNHNVSDGYSWTVIRNLSLIYCRYKISLAQTGLYRAAGGSLDGKCVTQLFPVLKIVWVSSVPRKHLSAPFQRPAGFERVPWKFVLWFSLAMLEVLRPGPEPSTWKSWLNIGLFGGLDWVLELLQERSKYFLGFGACN